MSLYFISTAEYPHSDPLNVKIGISGNISRRLGELQTGSPYKLRLMGYIDTRNDRKLEKELHKKYSDYRENGEWFCLNASVVLEELRCHSTNSYISLEENVFEICSYDSDGIPEIVGAWEWGDIDFEDFCPQCGWGGGVHYNDAADVENCLQCGFPVF